MPVDIELCPLEYQDEETEREKRERLKREEEELSDPDIPSDWERVTTSIPSVESSSMRASAPNPETAAASLLSTAASYMSLSKFWR